MGVANGLDPGRSDIMAAIARFVSESMVKLGLPKVADIIGAAHLSETNKQSLSPVFPYDRIVELQPGCAHCLLNNYLPDSIDPLCSDLIVLLQHDVSIMQIFIDHHLLVGRVLVLLPDALSKETLRSIVRNTPAKLEVTHMRASEAVDLTFTRATVLIPGFSAGGGNSLIPTHIHDSFQQIETHFFGQRLFIQMSRSPALARPISGWSFMPTYRSFDKTIVNEANLAC